MGAFVSALKNIYFVLKESIPFMTQVNYFRNLGGS